MKTKQGAVTPGGITRTGAKAGMVVALLFLLFGLVFGGVVLSDMPRSEWGLALLVGTFLLIWVVICIAQIVLFRRILAKRETVGDNSFAEIHFQETVGAETAGADDFEARLRKLERLKKDSLITEAEYLDKRAQMMQEKW